MSPKFKFPAMLGPAEEHPVGSPGWAECILNRLQYKYEYVDIEQGQFLTVMDAVIEGKAWEVFPEEKPFGDIDTMIAAVIGCSLKDLEAKLAKLTPKIAEAKGPTPEHGTNRHSRGYNITSRTHDRGDSAEYLIRRLLKEDRKDLVDKIIAGKLSASAAGIEAGIKRPYRSVPIDGPVEAVTALLRVFSREQLLTALQEKEDV